MYHGTAIAKQISCDLPCIEADHKAAAMAYLGVLSSGLVWLCLSTIFLSLPLAISDEHEDDRQALLCFKSQLSGPTGVLATWSNASQEFCNWHGVSCSTRSPRRVTAIDSIRRLLWLHITLHCQSHHSYKVATIRQ